MTLTTHIPYFHQKVSLPANPLVNSTIDSTLLIYEMFFIHYFIAYNLIALSILTAQAKSFHLFRCKMSLSFFYVISFYFSCTFDDFSNK
jgi:hypothetical protein